MYEETIDESTKKQLEKLKVDLSNKISSVKDVVCKFKETVNARLDGLPTPTLIQDEQVHVDLVEAVESSVESVKEQLKKCDSEIKKDLDTMDEEYEARFQYFDTKIGNLRTQIDEEHTSKMSTIDTKLTKLESDLLELRSLTERESRELNRSIHSDDIPAPLYHDQAHTRVDDKTKLIMCMDSNSKFLDQRKLWDLDGTQYRRCYTLAQVKVVLNRDVKYTNLKYFLISVGCNDLDYGEAAQVFADMKEIVLNLQQAYPGIKIIIGEITPRMDDRDEVVKDINFLIQQFGKSSENVFVIDNSNLRNKKFFYAGDSKHIRKDCIGRFAANIKHTLRVAYGRRKYVPPTQDHDQYPIPLQNQQTHQQQHQQHHLNNQQHLHHNQYQQQQQPQQHQWQQQQQQQQQQHQQLQLLLWCLNHLNPSSESMLSVANNNAHNVSRVTDTSVMDISQFRT